MWMSKAALRQLDWFQNIVTGLREEVSSIQAERDSLKLQLGVQQNQFSWLCSRVNALELERAQLLEKASGIKTIVPEIARAPSPEQIISAFTFDDVGDDMAKKLGLPVYGDH